VVRENMDYAQADKRELENGGGKEGIIQWW
jgi:hypothetical protein